MMNLRLLFTAALAISTTASAGLHKPTTIKNSASHASPAPLNMSVTNMSAASTLSGNQTECPNRGRMDRLCQYIFNRSPDMTPDSYYSFEYQRIIYDSACVDFENDTDEEISRKVRAAWELYGKGLKCGPMGVPSTGSPLRYAMHLRFDDFVSDAINMWNLDLNEIENEQTHLDFLEERMSKASGLLLKNLQNYHRAFIRHGAKRRSELK